jgi:hypothetical protein
MKASFTILLCHASVRCDFRECAFRDPEYTLASSLALLMAIFLGIRLPLHFFLIVRQRAKRLQEILKSKETWAEFCKHDRSLMAPLYNKYMPRWIYFNPVNSILALLIILATVVPEEGSTLQIVLLSLATTLQVAVIALSAPYANKWVLLIELSGSVHNMVAQAFGNLIALDGSRGNTSSTLQYPLFAWSCLYLAGIAYIALRATILPALRKPLAKHSVAQLSKRCGTDPKRKSFVRFERCRDDGKHDEVEMTTRPDPALRGQANCSTMTSDASNHLLRRASWNRALCRGNGNKINLPHLPRFPFFVLFSYSCFMSK